MSGRIKVPSELVPAQDNQVMLRSKYVFDDVKHKTQEEVNNYLEGKIEDKVMEAGGVNWDEVPTASSNNAVKSKDIKKALENITGYFVLDNNVTAATVDKTVTVNNLQAIANGGSIKIKMLTANTAANPTLRIGPSTATAYPLYYNGERASATNSWEENEIISVFFDGANYQASNSQGGGKNVPRIIGGESNLDIVDEEGNILAKFYNGNFKVKNFNSVDAITTVNSPIPFEIEDENGYVIVRFEGGHIKTKNFNSADYTELLYTNLHQKKMCIIGDSYVANHNESYTLTWHYKIAQDNEMTYVNYGVNGNGLVASGSPAIGTPVVDRYTDMDDDADYVIVVGGKNDYNKQISIADFKTGLATLCAGLINKYAVRGSKIAFFTPWDDFDAGTDSSAIKLIQYVDAMIEVCGKYSIPIFDSSRKSSIFMFNSSFRTNYCQSSTDISHLNSAGHNLFKNKAFNFLNQL